MSLLQKKHIEVGNMVMKFKQLKELDRDEKGMHEKMANAIEALQAFLDQYATHVTAADITTKDDDEDQMQSMIEKLAKDNGDADSHLRGVRACLAEAAKA